MGGIKIRVTERVCDAICVAGSCRVNCPKRCQIGQERLKRKTAVQSPVIQSSEFFSLDILSANHKNQVVTIKKYSFTLNSFTLFITKKEGCLLFGRKRGLVPPSPVGRLGGVGVVVVVVVLLRGVVLLGGDLLGGTVVGKKTSGSSFSREQHTLGSLPVKPQT
ncbi:hypothetical protein AVEN_129686-1 [Araneus ventricosus]|uniref:Uncharacterized protein n=1 Tax=Araneus ventricosus TaxID=182803 RepID=A0A4Y2VI92_ARAVE|nr:hypothetical protein AVEN_129686-1 [Araneus ventricosus]